eukprot:GHVS01080622.1.p1 GENE.GHVS01080622.1~~GHVS01080622.1.p1  ORF type:complete len:104 (+),score=1.21 GHVS01080622.1:124-435(+)
MGFVRVVICPFVIAAATLLLLLLPMISVTSDGLKVGNTGIYFVSEPLCPKLFVTKPDVETVLDRESVEHRVLSFSSVGEAFKPLCEIKRMSPEDAETQWGLSA